jgi:serine/threonine protein kinase
MKRFDLKEIIGENVESIIQKAVKLEDDDEVMLKHLKRRFYSWEECLQINELKVARLCQHDYMLQLKEIIRLKHKDEMTLVYEPVETSLFNYFNVYKEKRIFLLENNIRVILYQVLQVLSHLHNNNLVHRDI